MLYKIKTAVHEALALDYISKDLADFLIQEYPKVPSFYLLSKIHKPGFLPKGRTIVAAQGSALENISKYIDSLLQPYVLQIKSYIKDTRDFIQQVEHYAILDEAVLLTMDVTSLYNSIPHEDVRLTVHRL